MSIFSKIGGFLKKTALPAVGGFLTGGPAGALAGAVGGYAASKQPRMPNQLVAMPGGGRLATPGQIMTGMGGAVGGIARNYGLWPTTSQLAPLTGSSAQSGYSYRRLYNKNGTPRRIKANGQPYAIPHMNPMNPRAARRAVVRIRGARKLLQRIERSLPRQTTRRRAAAR